MPLCGNLKCGFHYWRTSPAAAGLRFGYLKREALEEFSNETGVPLYRLQAVASFFPHFQLAPPKPVTVRVCRDMSCHLAGAGKMLQELSGLTSDQVGVEGVSCLGRC